MGKTALEKSMDFAVRIVRLYQYLCREKKEFVMSKQILRSGTSIGANLREAKYAQSTNDFISKNSIALKEVSETEYWLELLFKTDYLTEKEYNATINRHHPFHGAVSNDMKTARRCWGEPNPAGCCCSSHA